MEEFIYYLPFVVLAKLLRIEFRFTCAKCGKPLFFDWMASRLGTCRAHFRENPNNLDGYYKSPNVFVYKNIMPLIGDGFILDAGCGEGFLISRLNNSRRCCIGIDCSRNEIKRAVLSVQGSSFFVGDVTHLPFNENTFDWIVSVEVLEHIIQPKMALAEFYRVVKEGGHVLLSVPNGDVTGHDDIGHINFFSLVQFSSLVKSAGFKIKMSRSFGLEIPFITYIGRAIAAYTQKNIPFRNPINIYVPQVLATNFLILATK